MGLIKGIFRIIHPNKVKRPYQQLAERQKSAINIQAATEQEAAKLRRDHNLTAVTDAYNKAKKEYNLAYNNELSQITGDHNQKHAEYLGLLNNLQQTKQQHIEQIVANFNRLTDQLLANQQLEQERLVACIEKVATLHSKCKNNYNNHKLLLDNLWHQITTNMLHQDCITGYDQLKQFDNSYVVKAKYYSLLVGYFKQLAAQNIISNADFDRYKKFLYTVCNTNNKLEQNIDFCAIDREITDVLANIIHQEQEILSFAHQQDHHNNQVSYNKSIEFDNILHQKFEETKQQILNKYAPALLNLTNERDQKHQELEDNYATIKNQVDAEWNNYQNTHNAYINNLNDNKTTIEREFDNQEQQEKAKINENYQTELQSIATSVKNILEKIDNDLNAQLKQLKHAVRASIVNLFTSITTAVAAYFSGGLLSGVSEYIEKSVQLSFTTTSLGALENLVKDREKFGFTTIINFPRDQPIQDFQSEVRRNVATQNQQGSDFSANLAKLKKEFSIFNQQVHTWQTQAEHDLFYSLNQSIFVRPNFSNALAVYSSQTYKFNFGIEAELGGLQANGFRNIKWHINLDNNQWYGNYLMRDRDIRNIIHKITNNSSELNNNWQHPQRLSFNNNSPNWLTRFKQNYINIVSSPKSRVTSQQEAASQLIGSALATKTQPVSTALSNPNEQTTYRQASNLRWLEQLELFSSGLNHFTPQGQASNSWRNNDFDLESMVYNAQSKMILSLYQQHKVGTRVMGAMQSGVGVGQLGLAVALAETGVGVAPACLLAARGADNLVAGGMAFVTGQDTPTILHQAVRGVGFSDTAASWIEFGVDLSPVAPCMMKNAGGMMKTGVLKLYDLRASRQPVISASTPAEIAWGTGELSYRQTTLLEALPKAKSKLTLHKSAINTTDIAALTAYTGNEFAIFTRGSQRLVIRGYNYNMALSIENLQLLKQQGFQFSAHTHPIDTTFSRYVLDASSGDRLALKIFEQERSLILDSLGRRNIVSSPNLRVDTPKLPSSSSSTPAVRNLTSTKISRETQRLIDKTDRYKSELFERAGKTKVQTTLNAAKIELQGQQIDLAIERGVCFDHVTKVQKAQRGLLNHLEDINGRLNHPQLPMIERKALEAELSKASKLLDHTEKFVPRTTAQPLNYPKPRAT